MKAFSLKAVISVFIVGAFFLSVADAQAAAPNIEYFTASSTHVPRGDKVNVAWGVDAVCAMDPYDNNGSVIYGIGGVVRHGGGFNGKHDTTITVTSDMKLVLKCHNYGSSDMSEKSLNITVYDVAEKPAISREPWKGIEYLAVVSGSIDKEKNVIPVVEGESVKVSWKAPGAEYCVYDLIDLKNNKYLKQYQPAEIEGEVMLTMLDATLKVDLTCVGKQDSGEETKSTKLLLLEVKNPTIVQSIVDTVSNVITGAADFVAGTTHTVSNAVVGTVSTGTATGTPTLTVTAKPETVSVGGSAVFSWEASNVKECKYKRTYGVSNNNPPTAETGDIKLIGNFTEDKIAKDIEYTVTCMDFVGKTISKFARVGILYKYAYAGLRTDLQDFQISETKPNKGETVKVWWRATGESSARCFYGIQPFEGESGNVPDANIEMSLEDSFEIRDIQTSYVVNFSCGGASRIETIDINKTPVARRTLKVCATDGSGALSGILTVALGKKLDVETWYGSGVCSDHKLGDNDDYVVPAQLTILPQAMIQGAPVGAATVAGDSRGGKKTITGVKVGQVFINAQHGQDAVNTQLTITDGSMAQNDQGTLKICTQENATSATIAAGAELFLETWMGTGTCANHAGDSKVPAALSVWKNKETDQGVDGVAVAKSDSTGYEKTVRGIGSGQVLIGASYDGKKAIEMFPLTVTTEVSTSAPTLDFGVRLSSESGSGTPSLSTTVGRSATLVWTSLNTTSCAASGGWSGFQGPVATSNTLVTDVFTKGTVSYILECKNASGVSTGAKTVTITATEGILDTIKNTVGSWVGSKMNMDSFKLAWSASETGNAVSATISWDVTGAKSCSYKKKQGDVVSGGDGQSALKNSFTETNIVEDVTYTLTCVGSDGKEVVKTRTITQAEFIGAKAGAEAGARSGATLGSKIGVSVGVGAEMGAKIGMKMGAEAGVRAGAEAGAKTIK